MGCGDGWFGLWLFGVFYGLPRISFYTLRLRFLCILRRRYVRFYVLVFGCLFIMVTSEHSYVSKN